MSSSASYTSTSYTSSSSQNGHVTASSYTSQATSNSSGTEVRITSQNSGEPVYEETRRYDLQGQEMLGAAGCGGGLMGDRMQVEDVTETAADTAYREAMSDEYAKREGGA